MSRLPLAIPCGDPAGVGPDLIASWLRAHPALADSVVPIGPADWIARLGRGLAVGPAAYVSHPGPPDEAEVSLGLPLRDPALRDLALRGPGLRTLRHGCKVTDRRQTGGNS
jgi:hypothetical protein